MIKLIFFFSSLCILLSCSTNKDAIITDDNVKVLSINKNELTDFHFLECKLLSAGDTIIVLSNKEVAVSPKYEQVKSNSTYFFDLKKMSVFKEKKDVAGILFNKQNIYIDGKLIFPKNVKVFEANNLYGLHVNL